MAVVTSLDTIVRNVLMRREYPLHWYIPFMVYAKDCLRNMSTDVLQVINTKLVPLDDYNAADIPDDCLNIVRVGYMVGQMVKPLVPYDKINSLNNFTSTFGLTTYDETTDDDDDNELVYNYSNNFWLTTHYNSYGENVGRFYGISGGDVDNYKIIPQRNQIQVNEGLSVDYIVVEYISDGQDADSATNIDGMAQDAIEAYILWQMKENSRTYNDGERMRAKNEYVLEWKKFVARKNPLDTNLVARILQNATYGFK